ncbi:HAD hydrolase-like protein [Elusimicrobiota bacterium]
MPECHAGYSYGARSVNPELILFDFGGVISPEGFQLGVLKMSMEFEKSFQKMYELVGYYAGLKSGYTTGKISEERYWEIVEERLNIKESMRHYRSYFLDNFQPRNDMVALMKNLYENGYKLGIFSDQTNWIYEINEKVDFMQYCKYKFISWKLGYTKHDDEFFLIPSRESGIPPDKILVIDDKPRVIGKVKKVGMEGYLFTTVNELQDYLKQLLS